jgi:zinc carboxypeptidase
MLRASRVSSCLAAAAVAGASMVTPAAQRTRPAPARAQATPVPEPRRSSLSLAKFFDVGPVFQDRNSDGVVDFVDARIVLGERPSASDVAAAANVAARLGFETSAMNLPMPASAAGASIIIGAAGLRRAGVSIDLPKDPGEGLVTTLDVSGKPAVVIAGASDAATRAAADAFSGRLPKIWEPSAPSIETVAKDVQTFLSEHGVGQADVSIPAVFVTPSSDAFARLFVNVRVNTAADVARAQSALSALAASRRGASAAKAAARVTTTAPVSTSAPNDKNEKTPLTYVGARELLVRVGADGAASAAVTIPRVKGPEPGPIPRRPGGAAKEALDLSTVYTNDGFFGTSNNAIPDRFDVLLSPSGDGIEGVVDLAARIGLESAGVTLPLVQPPDALGRPESEPMLVLIGTTHPLIDQLQKSGKFERPTLGAGEGLIQVVKNAFGTKPAVIVTGGDARGVARAVSELAERLPNVWTRGKDRTTVDDVEEDARRFLAARSPAGQAAAAIYHLDRIATELAGKDLETAQVLVSIEKPPDGFEQFVRSEAAAKIKAGRLDVVIDNRDVQRAKPLIDDQFDIPSEVDDFWKHFRTEVLPAVKKNQPVVVEARLSEPPELRAQIATTAKAELVKAGAPEAQTKVTVLSAYKQGYSWLYDVVRPALAGKPIDSIVIRFAEIGAPPEWPQQAMFTPTRWLLELFPIDEILARELKIDLKKIRFEKMPVGSPTYQVVVTGGGAEILRQTFEPKYVLRSFFDVFPDYEKVRVTTGWIDATVGGRPVVDKRIVTDLERFWDHFQGTTLKAVYDHVMRVSKGKPRVEDAPWFGELVVDLTLSEPNYRLDLDNEQIMSLEMMTEEIYFNTLHFFDVLGRYARGQGLNYVGRVIPIMHPKGDGKAGHARITFSGFATDRPAIVVSYQERGGRKDENRRNIGPIAVERPSALAARVRDGQNGLTELDLRAKVDTENDQRKELLVKARAEQIDASMISAEQVNAVVAALGRLRAAGLYKDALAYHDLGTIKITAGWEFESKPATERVSTLAPNGTPAPFPDVLKLLPPGYKYNNERIVQWDTPIPPPEGHQMVARMVSAFKEATAYKISQSYLGKDIWVMELHPPIEASHVSMAKMTTLKPTIVYSARQDANEVSSTSHTLRLAELLLTDPEFKAKLKKVNVVFHPFTNPDGAQLAYDLYKINRDYMLHPGYLGPLGVSLVSRWDTDPTYPESGNRPKLWRTFLPDIFLNPHGYPSHEWVQIFSEYGGWVRNRVTEARDWQTMRGWFTPGFNYLNDPRYPRHKEAAFKIRDMFTKNIDSVPDIHAFNQRAYDRYRRYGHEFDSDTFRLDFTNNVLVYTSLKGQRAEAGGGRGGGGGGGGDDFVTRNPNITVWYGSTEAPDETAYGPWMNLVATMGLQWDKALLQYLVDGNHVVERRGETFWGGVSLSLNRARPPRPASESRTTASPSQGGSARPRTDRQLTEGR